MKEIQLTRGQVALVDDADFEWLNQWKWFALKGKDKKTLYAQRNIPIAGKQKGLKMHRLILGLDDPEIFVDHIDTNGLNNQRHNLRLATSSQSACNRTRRISNISKYKGVTWRKDNKKWRVYVGKSGVQKRFGQFDNEKDAAAEYNKQALIIHGEFAHLNVL